MIIFVYDKTFEGLLTAVFDAYSRRTFPDLLVTEGEPFPLFYDEAIRIYTDDRKAERVWKGLEKKISKSSLSGLTDLVVGITGSRPVVIQIYPQSDRCSSHD